MMKTLLIQPDAPKMYRMGSTCSRSFPLGLGYIAAVLEKYYDVIIIDMRVENIPSDSLKAKIAEINPKIVGITSDTISFHQALEIAQIVKQVNKEITVVIGGAHANALPTNPLKYDCFDISVYGEGEKTARELWRRIEKDLSWEDVNSIAFRKNGEIVVNPKNELIENLDELPLPARHLFPVEKYSGEFDGYARPVFPVNTSRGCPFSCSFCSNNVLFGRKYRFRSPQNVVDEIEMLINDYQAKGIHFTEDIFTANKNRVIEICDEITKRNLHFKWFCESRVNTIDRQMLQRMKHAGCEVVWFGVESGSQRILNLIDKKITLEQSKQAFRLCKKIKLKAGATFMIGIPGEKIEDMYQTIDFAKKLEPEFAWFSIYTAYPVSPLYKYVMENKLYDKDLGHGIMAVKTEEFDREKLETIQKYADRVVNRNIKKIFKLSLSSVKQGKVTPKKMAQGLKYALECCLPAR